MICLHDAQRKQHIVLNDAGVHLFDGRLVFSRGGNGSSLSATHLPPSILHGGRTAVYGSPPASFSSISGEGVVPSPPPGFQLTISDVVPFMVSSFQPVLVDAVASLMYGFRPLLLMQQVSFQPLEPFNDLRLMDMNIFLGVGLMYGKYFVPLEDPPPPLLTDERLDSSAIEYLDATVAETMDSLLA